MQLPSIVEQRKETKFIYILSFIMNAKREIIFIQASEEWIRTYTQSFTNESLESFRDETNLGYIKLKVFNEHTECSLNSYLISTRIKIIF